MFYFKFNLKKNIMDINKFCYEHITGKDYDEYIASLIERGFALEVTEVMYK